MIGSRGEWRDEHDEIVCVPADDNVRDGEADDKFRCAAQIVECVCAARATETGGGRKRVVFDPPYPL